MTTNLTTEQQRLWCAACGPYSCVTYLRWNAARLLLAMSTLECALEHRMVESFFLLREEVIAVSFRSILRCYYDL